MLVEQPLLKIINAKNKFIDGLLKNLDKEFGILNKTALSQLKKALQAGQADYETINAILGVGYDDVMATYVEQYAETMKFLQQAAEYMDMPFAISEKGLDVVGFMQEQNLATLYKTKEMYAQRMAETAAKSVLEDKTFKQLVDDFQANLDGLWRNAKLEVAEGIKTFDRAVHAEQMKEAGIERFVYVGPDDDVTRDACKAVLDDPRQETGWTREDIAGLADVSFVGGGGWNCRHDWYPFIEEYE